MKQKLRFSAGIGTSSILMVFVMLCIIIFGVLALVSANTDDNLTKKSQQATEMFYKAEASAAETLCDIDETLVLAEQYTTNSIELSNYIKNAIENKKLTVAKKDKLEQDLKQTKTEKERFVVIASLLLSEKQFATEVNNDDLTVSFTVPMGEARTLSVKVLSTPFEKQRYHIVLYQTISNEMDDQIDDNNIQVWDGK